MEGHRATSPRKGYFSDSEGEIRALALDIYEDPFPTSGCRR